jgi:hypothetical protein
LAGVILSMNRTRKTTTDSAATPAELKKFSALVWMICAFTFQTSVHASRRTPYSLRASTKRSIVTMLSSFGARFILLDDRFQGANAMRQAFWIPDKSGAPEPAADTTSSLVERTPFRIAPAIASAPFRPQGQAVSRDRCTVDRLLYGRLNRSLNGFEAEVLGRNPDEATHIMKMQTANDTRPPA